MPRQGSNQYFPFDYSFSRRSKLDHPSTPTNHADRGNSLVLFLRRPVSTILTSQLTVLLIAFFAALTSIRNHASMLSDAMTLSCIAKDYIPLPHFLSQICTDDITGNSHLSLLSNRIEKLEDAIAILHATQQTPPIPFRNFALRGGGATIDPLLTSRTHRLPPRSIKSQFLNWFRGHDVLDANINLPIIILEDLVEVGEFWEFEGDKGTVGIILSERVHITSFSFNYIQPFKVSSSAMSRAPRNLSLWGYVDSDFLEAEIFTTTTKSRGYRRPLSEILGRSGGSVAISDRYGGGFLPLAHAEYNISSKISLQNFPITDKSLHGISFRTFLLEISDNWGGNTTCIYHLGIHGLGEGE